VWFRSVLPFEPAVREELFEETDLLLYNSLVGTVVVAGAQAVLLGVAFLVLGLGNVVFWIVTTFVAAMIPLVGASIIWLPASAYLLIIGRPVPAVVLLAFGAIVISTVDNLLRPMVMRRGHSSVLLLRSSVSSGNRTLRVCRPLYRPDRPRVAETHNRYPRERIPRVSTDPARVRAVAETVNSDTEYCSVSPAVPSNAPNHVSCVDGFSLIIVTGTCACRTTRSATLPRK